MTGGFGPQPGFLVTGGSQRSEGHCSAHDGLEGGSDAARCNGIVDFGLFVLLGIAPL